MSSANNGFFNSQNHDRVYDADDFNKVFSMLAVSGIDLTNNANGLKVSAQSPNAMYVDVAIGSAIVNGGWIEPTSVTSLAIPTSSVSYNRYDAVVIEFNRADNTRAVALKVVQGVASSTPSYPDLTQTDNIYQIPLAYVLVEANASSISDSDITDVRSDYWLSANVRKATSEYLGIVKGGDTVTIDDEGTINVNIASRTQLGGVKVGQNLRITPDGTLNATGGGGGGASALSDLEDVDIDFSTLASGQALIYDDTDDMWKNENAETEPPSLATLPDVNIENLQFGQILRFNSTNGKWENCNWNELPINKTFEKQASVESLASARYNMMSAKAGNQLIFAGGQGASTSYNVDAYNDSLTRTTGLPLNGTRYDGAGASVGNYALFGGGIPGTPSVSYSSGYPVSNNAMATVEGYDASLTKITVPNLSQASSELSAVDFNDYAVFIGGHYYEGWLISGGTAAFKVSVNKSQAYDDSLTAISLPDLTNAKSCIDGAIISNRILVAGGIKYTRGISGSYDGVQNSAKYATVETYDESFTLSSAPDLSSQRYSLAGASTPTHAVFGGGYESAAVTTVEAYDDSLTKSALASLGSARYTPNNLDGAYNDGWLLFSGLSNNNVDAYDDSLTKNSLGQTGALGQLLDPARTYIKLDTIGDYFVFAGGYANSASSDVVEAYKVNHY